MPPTAVLAAVSRLASREGTRTEADIQADVYFLLTSGSLALQPWQVARLEVPTNDGTRRRLDVEIGHCVIEVKKDLRLSGVRSDAEAQLAGYVRTQTDRLEARYVGILTDGTDWCLYHLEGGNLQQAAHLSLNPTAPDTDRLLIWLEAILATQPSVQPTPLEIARRLGADSPAHLLDQATLRAMYDEAASIPEVKLKRDLWAKLLRTAFGRAFIDDERLFINHTLLVLTAEIIAHAVVGFDVSNPAEMPAATLVQGAAFASAEIHGVVEADFFDWVLHAPGGSKFVSELARRLARFNWSKVEHDVLKTIYESVIAAESRASLGEYYTPDWLADRVVDAAIAEPLTQRILDPACGSGTFLFHAVRAYLRAADEAGVPNGRAVAALTERVCGMDIHPVAVTLARVTYLLAIGKERLAAEDREPIAIPVYLGDSIQWEQRRDLFGGLDTVTISTAGDDLVDGGAGVLFGDDLAFPRRVLRDAATFDRLVTAMANKATEKVSKSGKSSRDIVAPVLRQFGIHADDVDQLTATFDTMRRLQNEGRNHIWGYYVRNLIRPLWLSEESNKVDVLIGNPPWLRYSKMTKPMQDRYKGLAGERGLLSGGLGASGRDLSTLFVARTVELYLKTTGRFAFVMPHGTLTRKPHDGFRSGAWSSQTVGNLAVKFDEPWDLSAAPTGFPMVSCVIHGTLGPGQAKRMPSTAKAWTARLPSPNVTWAAAQGKFSTTSKRLSALDGSDLSPSPYKKRFRQGAIFVPRALLFVTEAPAGPLGAGAGRIRLQSRRTSNEKPPWKHVPSLNGTVEKAFVRRVHLGETLLPYRMLEPLRAVLPISATGILARTVVEEYPGLGAWWAEVEKTWDAHKSEGDGSTLLERLDYHGQLAAQLPAAGHRVLYSKAGNTLAAARISNPDFQIDHMLYWAAASSLEEARYLTAILNSTTVLERVKPLQALGLFGARHFDKAVFSVPIPTYDSEDSNHNQLVALATEAEEIAHGIELGNVRDFKVARRLIRDSLASSGLARKLDETVARVIPERQA
ncbi:N-6 DNA methylase [Micromonospora sp. NPDC049374]|uniref:N-6 DNA methylase n=1 Tax=Micromonospora sp. NPDC049374 TaxID=3154352 RepID=UPI00344A1D82